MTTEQRFKVALREMMQTTPLSEINVTTLCDKLHLHRQTFYYHFQDIYDLLASIFLNEDVPGLINCNNVKEILECLLEYSKRNFEFLHFTYQSAGADLVTDFYYNKILTRLITVYSPHESGIGLTKATYRSVARRFSASVSQEFSFAFKSQGITVSKLETFLKKYINSATLILYPAIVSMVKEEKKR